MSIYMVLYVYLGCINLVGLLLMGLDKRRAIRQKWRIRERTLFLTALIGGSLGILSGMYLFRHKTLHSSFRFGIPLIICLQILGIFYIYRYYTFM